MKSIRSETLWTREFLGLSLSNFLIYVTQYAMIAALPIIIMTEYGGGHRRRRSPAPRGGACRG